MLTFFLASCANEQANQSNQVNYDEIAPTVLSVTADKSNWNQDNNTYLKNIKLRVSQPDVYPVSVIVCFLQNPMNKVNSPIGIITPSEFERLGFQKQGCTSLTYDFEDDTEQTLIFNVLEAIKDIEGNHENIIDNVDFTNHATTLRNFYKLQILLFWL